MRILLMILTLLLCCAQSAHSTIIPLAGEWKVRIDSLGVGENQKWYLEDQGLPITLPGTLTDAGYGNPYRANHETEHDVYLNLKSKFSYVGAAFYSRNINLPKDMSGKYAQLYLERIIWQSDVWINGIKLSESCNSLISPHRYDLSGYLHEDSNMIVVRVDNRKKHYISHKNLAHAYTNETQTIWNGIVGAMELRIKDNLNIKCVDIHPVGDKIGVKTVVNNCYGDKRKATMTIAITSKNDPKVICSKNISVECSSGESTHSITINRCSDMEAWSEFNPALYNMRVSIATKDVADTTIESFGLRELGSKDGLLTLNGKRIFLRGTLECSIFPLTGYTATSYEDWRKIMEVNKSYGLNHLRFHSWCPPREAFRAADDIGMYLQIENPLWVLTVGKDRATTQFIRDEAMRIVEEYGNHPSFCFMSLGNELEGDFNFLNNLKSELQAKDSRHLYTTTTFTFQKGHGRWYEPGDDFWVSQWSKYGHIRGRGFFDVEQPSYCKGYKKEIQGVQIPVISHEIGQYAVFPDLNEIKKYKGNMMPLNFIKIRDDLKAKGRLGIAKTYTDASGQFAKILYKEDIERVLRSSGFSGFQMLGLQDFSGQGTALVGMVDAFWDNKGIISADKFSEFCSGIVPLALIPKVTYTNAEDFTAQLSLANFSDNELKNIILDWSLDYPDGKSVAKGSATAVNCPVGNDKIFTHVTTNLSSIDKATKLIFRLGINGTQHNNEWDIWVYPSNKSVEYGSVVYTRNLNEALTALEKGQKVLFNPVTTKINGITGKFIPVFWSPVHFSKESGAMGILCNPAHRALTDFPTESHSNWQWWDLCKKSSAVDIQNCKGAQTIVGMVDNFVLTRDLSLIFEAKCNGGNLIFCAIDLGDDMKNRIEATQLLSSLTDYMNSGSFAPQSQITEEDLKGFIKKENK